MLLHGDRFGTRSVNQHTKGVLGVLGRHGLHNSGRRAEFAPTPHSRTALANFAMLRRAPDSDMPD